MCKVYKNIEYSSHFFNGNKNPLTMDIFLPEGEITGSAKSLIIFAHPGFFILGSKEDMHEFCLHFVKLGFVCASINYSMMPEHISDADAYINTVSYASIDIGNAVRFFKKDSALDNRYGVDGNAIFVCGYSAGAIAALVHVFSERGTEGYSVLGHGNSTKVIAEMIRKRMYTDYDTTICGLISIAGALPDIKLEVSPALPPILFIHGSADEIVPSDRGYIKDIYLNPLMPVAGSISIAADLQKAKLEYKFLELEQGDHSSPFSTYKSNTISEIEIFLKECMDKNSENVFFI